MLLYDIIARGATEYPERTAIIFRDSPITYGALAAQVNRLAGALYGRGIGAGDRVAVLLPNCPPVTFVYIAAREETPDGILTLAELMQEGDPQFNPQSVQTDARMGAIRNPQSNDPAVCIYTSGTTGRPKGALLSHRNLTVNCEQVTKAL